MNNKPTTIKEWGERIVLALLLICSAERSSFFLNSCAGKLCRYSRISAKINSAWPGTRSSSEAFVSENRSAMLSSVDSI